MPTTTRAPDLSYSLEIIPKVGVLGIREIFERVRVPNLLGPRRVRAGGTDRRSLRGLRGKAPLFVVAPREDDASDGEGDVEEHVEAEVGGEALVVARRITALEYLESGKEFQRQRMTVNQRKEKGPITYIMLRSIHGKGLPVAQSCCQRPTR